MRIEINSPRNLHPKFDSISDRRIGGEPAGILFVHTGEIVRAHQQDPDFDHVVERGACRPHLRLPVAQRLASLSLNRVSGKLPVAGSVPTMPDTSTIGPAFTA
jgi:hypothetical protein